MPAKRKAATAAPAKSLEAQLWDAADKMRGAVPPTDYMHVCLGMVFLRYLSAAFDRKHAELLHTPHADPDDPEEYQADNVFWVPEESRWSTLQRHARAADIGKRLDDAMRAIERDNEHLKGVLPKIFGKADFSSQIQHIFHHLTPDGYAAVILANGSMSSNSGGEGEIRKAMVEGDAVDCMMAMPNQLFFGVQIPVCVWIMAKDKSGGKRGARKLRDRRGEVLFLDARKLGHMVSRTQKNLSPEDIAKLAETYHAWREGRAYGDIPGFCKSANLTEIRAHGHVLTPGRYVGAEDVEDDDEPFEEKLPRLAAALRERFAKRAVLEKQVNANLEGMGYGR
jgi:type I restriction-modification system DNA methylase subunit